MTLTEGQIKMMQEDMYAELIQILMEKYGIHWKRRWIRCTTRRLLRGCRIQTQDCITRAPDMCIRS